MSSFCEECGQVVWPDEPHEYHPVLEPLYELAGAVFGLPCAIREQWKEWARPKIGLRSDLAKLSAELFPEPEPLTAKMWPAMIERGREKINQMTGFPGQGAEVFRWCTRCKESKKLCSLGENGWLCMNCGERGTRQLVRDWRPESYYLEFGSFQYMS